MYSNFVKYSLETYGSFRIFLLLKVKKKSSGKHFKSYFKTDHFNILKRDFWKESSVTY